MAQSIDFEWRPNLRVVAREFDEMAWAVQDFRSPLNISREVALGELEDRFAAGGPSPTGEAWPEWSESWANDARNQGSMLRQSGEMQDAVTTRSAWVVIGDELVWNSGGAPERWLWHNDGIPGRLPQREFIGLSDAAQNDIHTIFEGWLGDVVTFADPGRAARIQPRGSGGRFGKVVL